MKFFLVLISLMITLSPTYAWEKILKEDGIEVYTKPLNEGLMPFKAEAALNYPVEEILAVLKNHAEKNQWSPKLKEVKIHSRPSEKRYIFSEYYRTPWPAMDREFLLAGEIQEDSRGGYILEAKSIQENKLKDRGHIQADVKALNLYLKKISPGQTQIIFEFQGDMNGWIPIWISNLIQKKWPLRFIQGLRAHLNSRN